MRIARTLAVLSALIYLTGCASGAQMGNMVYNGPVKTYDTAVKNSVNVTNVSGGEETNPAWTSEISNEAFSGALKQSLRKQGLLSGNGRYKLEALLLEVDQPVFGLDFEVTTHVKYVLTDRDNNGAVVLNETIVAPYTATIGDAFAAIKRLRLANEGSGKANIEGLLEKLSELKIQPGDVTLEQ
ncbi:hypothetical protein D777_01647 [Marinobacter nitratireducens]|uniref:Lipoprotein n=1 Tax=Marinobacter nitratireducens TaxID=1137280 RepID=A0A072N2X4_9GAMM|nr:hypothetical protein [Marinobacter nitratireducens]KEF31298.1 hypothetical protein D777_01647 [Marinobacter nitratireducens]